MSKYLGFAWYCGCHFLSLVKKKSLFSSSSKRMLESIPSGGHYCFLVYVGFALFYYLFILSHVSEFSSEEISIELSVPDYCKV